MTIDNDFIADQFSSAGQAHGYPRRAIPFKTKSYSVAAFTLEKLPQSLRELPPEQITSIKGIGDAIGKKIQEILQTGELRLLREYILKTPPGLIQMLQIKGLGPKKIATIWKEMEIESIGELLYACQENRLLLYKGFGEKTQQNVADAIEFFLKNQGSHLYAEVEAYALRLHSLLLQHFKTEKISFTGDFRRQLEIIDQLEWVTTADQAAVKTFFEEMGLMQLTGGETDTMTKYKGPEGVNDSIKSCGARAICADLVRNQLQRRIPGGLAEKNEWGP